MATPFLKKLWTIVNDPSTNNIIRWREDGEGFVVLRFEELASRILPQYFKASTPCSFMRQLNLYGFNKIGDDPSVMEFKHSNSLFKKGEESKLLVIERRINAKKKRDSKATDEQQLQQTSAKHHKSNSYRPPEPESDILVKPLNDISLSPPEYQTPNLNNNNNSNNSNNHNNFNLNHANINNSDPQYNLIQDLSSRHDVHETMINWLTQEVHSVKQENNMLKQQIGALSNLVMTVASNALQNTNTPTNGLPNQPMPSQNNGPVVHTMKQPSMMNPPQSIKQQLPPPQQQYHQVNNPSVPLIPTNSFQTQHDYSYQNVKINNSNHNNNNNNIQYTKMNTSGGYNIQYHQSNNNVNYNQPRESYSQVTSPALSLSSPSSDYGSPHGPLTNSNTPSPSPRSVYQEEEEVLEIMPPQQQQHRHYKMQQKISTPEMKAPPTPNNHFGGPYGYQQQQPLTPQQMNSFEQYQESQPLDNVYISPNEWTF
eukprot:TRINITY_DN188_c2_g1_i1.p1 TRINITY_DN188_c2_g1~~TRINITY_DN188_c2_g1_i1.p1  ORF type:complete len:482 (-),score=146.89 TRINITY_DN188_c2_g1_i1:163-1608(-)